MDWMHTYLYLDLCDGRQNHRGVAAAKALREGHRADRAPAQRRAGQADHQKEHAGMAQLSFYLGLKSVIFWLVS